MALHKLTDAKARNFKGTGKIGDGGGLWLVSQESGAKQWFARISIQGKRREIGLGGYPVVTLEMARRFALEARRVAKEGCEALFCCGSVNGGF
ncbi:MAG: Arm DNA-binding domain-containing protein [Tateyamaria sp.]|uniref:Arm DNA-binding domain-containing protein n=1 Tax=Tateyamaria sp. TaxID=1929288 RepID=UPI0032896B77